MDQEDEQQTPALPEDAVEDLEVAEDADDVTGGAQFLKIEPGH